jgi:hypothetical protein
LESRAVALLQQFDEVMRKISSDHVETLRLIGAKIEISGFRFVVRHLHGGFEIEPERKKFSLPEVFRAQQSIDLLTASSEPEVIHAVARLEQVDQLVHCADGPPDGLPRSNAKGARS